MIQALKSRTLRRTPVVVLARQSTACLECWADIEPGDPITEGLKGWIHEECA